MAAEGGPADIAILLPVTGENAPEVWLSHDESTSPEHQFDVGEFVASVIGQKFYQEWKSGRVVCKLIGSRFGLGRYFAMRNDEQGANPAVSVGDVSLAGLRVAMTDMFMEGWQTERCRPQRKWQRRKRLRVTRGRMRRQLRVTEGRREPRQTDLSRWLL